MGPLAKMTYDTVDIPKSRYVSEYGRKSILKIPGLEPGTSQLSILSECAYHLRYIPVDPSAHTHSISGTGPSGSPQLTSSFKNPQSSESKSLVPRFEKIPRIKKTQYYKKNFLDF